MKLNWNFFFFFFFGGGGGGGKQKTFHGGGGMDIFWNCTINTNTLINRVVKCAITNI